MTRLSTLLALVALPLVFSCGDDAAEVFGDAQWQVRCPPGRPMCPQNGDAVDVFGFDGSEGTTATCNISDSGDGTVILDFAVGRGGQLMSVSGVVTGSEGGTVRGNSCRLTVIDDGNNYGGPVEGLCGANEPSEAQPCQIGPIVFDPGAMDGPELRTTIYCSSVASPSNPDLLVRDVTAPMAPSTPASIRVINCPGL